MRITEDTAKVLAVATQIAEDKHATMIRDTVLFAALCVTDTPAKEILNESVPNMELILERLGFDSDYEVDPASVKLLADRAFNTLRFDVRRLFSNAAELSRRTGFNGAVNPEHLLFVIISRRVSNHPEIFNSLEVAGADIDGIKNAIVNVFNEQAEAAREESRFMEGGDEGELPAEEGSARPHKPSGKQGGKSGHKTLDKFGKNLTELA